MRVIWCLVVLASLVVTGGSSNAHWRVFVGKLHFPGKPPLPAD